MTKDDSDHQVNWSSFFKTFVWFLALGLFLRIGFGNSLILFSFLIIGAFVSFSLAVETSGDNGRGKSVGVQKSVNKKEKVKEGSKTVKESDENDLVGRVIKYYGLVAKEGGVARLKVDKPIVEGDLIKFSSNKKNFTQEIEEIRAGGTKTKEVALEGEVSLRVDRRIKAGAKVFLVPDSRPAGAKDRIRKVRKKQKEKAKEREGEEDKRKSTEKSGNRKITEVENDSRKNDQEKEGTYEENEGIGKVQNYYELADKKGGLAKITIDEDLAVGDVIRFEGPGTDIVQKIRQLRPNGTETAKYVSGDHTSLRVYEPVKKGAIVKVESKIERPVESREERSDETQGSSPLKNAGALKKEGRELGKVTNYWNLASKEGGLAKFNACKEIKKGDEVHFYGENTDFSQTIELIKRHGKEVLKTSEGKKFDIRVNKRVRTGDVVLSTTSTTSNNKNESKKPETKKENKEKHEKTAESPEERRKRINSLLRDEEKVEGLEKEENPEKETETEFRSIAPSKQEEGVSLKDEKIPEDAETKEDTEEENSALEREVEECLNSKFLNRRAVDKAHLERLRERLLKKLSSQDIPIENRPDGSGGQSSVRKSEEDVKKDLRLSTQISAKYFNKSLDKLRSQLLSSLMDVDNINPKEEKKREAPKKRSRERIDFSENGHSYKGGLGFWSRWRNRVEKLEQNYFREEAGPLKETEKELAGQKNGVNSTVQNYFNSINTDIYSKQEEREAALRVDKGDESARREFIEHNLRLSIDIAKRYRWTNVRFEDLIQAGNEGLIKAVDKFDPDKGNKFSTYATYWVKQTIIRTVKRDRLIRLPFHIQEIQSKIEKIKRTLPPSEEISRNRIAKKLDVTPENVERAIKHSEPIVNLGNYLQFNTPDELGIKMDRRRLVKTKPYKEALRLKPLYTENKESGVGNKMEVPFVEIIEDLGAKIDRKEMWESYKEKLKKGLKDELTSRKYRILLLRYGFQTEEKTLEEVGKVFGVSRERIRQLQEQAIDDLEEVKLIKELNRYKLDYNCYEPIDRYGITEPWPDPLDKRQLAGGKNVW